VRVVADEPVEKMCKLLISEPDRVLARNRLDKNPSLQIKRGRVGFVR